jgi:small-conductance mechanosensitive channel
LYLKLFCSFDEFRAESGDLEQHLESELSKAEEKNTQLTGALLKLQEGSNESNISFRERLRESSAEVDKLHQELTRIQSQLETTRTQNRQLEQANDDLERHKREAEAVVESLREERDRIAEEKICLGIEYEEYILKTEENIQRQKQEIFELKSELQVSCLCLFVFV